MDGEQVLGAFQPAVGNLAGKKYSARPNAPLRHRQGKGHGRRCAFHHASHSAKNLHRRRSQQRLRRYHLPERPVVHSNAGKFSRGRSFSRWHPQIHRQTQKFEYHHGRSLELARRSVRQTGGRNCGRLDGTAWFSGGESGAQETAPKSRSNRSVTRFIFRMRQICNGRSPSPTR